MPMIHSLPSEKPSDRAVGFSVDNGEPLEVFEEQKERHPELCFTQISWWLCFSPCLVMLPLSHPPFCVNKTESGLERFRTKPQAAAVLF